MKNILIKQSILKDRIVDLIERLHPYHFDKGLIRMGPDGDGGYLVPNDLDNIQACFSPGVDNISDFELACLEYGMEIYLADKSVERVNLDIPPDQYSFTKKYVGCTNNDDFMTLDEWVNLNVGPHSSDLLLQMDIEGGEYDTLISTSDSLMNRFRIILIEFHFLRKLWNPMFFHFVEIVFSKILQTHVCIHIHPNNNSKNDSLHGVGIMDVAEFTFIRKDRIKLENYQTQFPHKLDSDNNIKRKHIFLPRNWHKES